ncbi:prepilin-type N-terminal cleavage/methylation domain-containing protein [Heyndrickxia coagulans]|uniref:prepilin-type N-terminal cleavage/methylation domain-containing protein n=1 Tax=Heyndrickxia coagulans TaxID=1398 RepID=UPI0023DDB5EF|nr:prepilin-type N-terminal cleavage/methylation domain-containing protein [Heyndrickxia coagulans]
MLHKKRKLLKNQKGFTLIELLAVIVILAIIAAIAIPAIANVIKNSRFNAIKSDAIQVINAAKLYASDNDVKPGETIKQVDLAKYVDDKDSKLNSYTVTVTTDGDGKIVYQLTGDGDDGGVKVHFKNANLADINSTKRTGDEVTIGK